MLTKQLELTNEQTSPLFRLMWVSEAADPIRRNFSNNICAFHIGNGFILSVAHNIKTEAQIFNSIEQSVFVTEILPLLNPVQQLLFNGSYPLDVATNKRHLNTSDHNARQALIAMLKQINFDTRWVTQMQQNFCKPHMIIQFKNDQFYNDPELTHHFNAHSYFPEPTLNKHTFLVEVELVEAFYNEDIALYKIVNTHQDIINRIPSIEPDFSILPDQESNYYCLQSSPNDFLGRLLNKAQIEGYSDHYATFPDPIGGNYNFEGLRYLIKGYFRFGSSGAPYVYFDQETERFKVNAIQSEACPVQLSINNNRDGNFQYVNALASPLNNVEARLKAHLNPSAV